MYRDFIIAWRRLRATPIFSLFAISSLALGIGATVAVYSVVSSLLWRPLGIKNPSQVVDLLLNAGRPVSRGAISWPDFKDLRSQQTTFSGMAAARRFEAALNGDGVAETVSGEAVNGEYFETLGVGPLIGRLIQPPDESLSAPVVVIGEKLWRRTYRSDASIIGRTVKLSGSSAEIIGVAPASFLGMSRYSPSAVWVSLTSPIVAADRRRGDDAAARDDRSLSVKGRLKSGEAILRAASDVALVGRRLDAAFPKEDLNGGHTRPAAQARVWSVSANAEADQQWLSSSVGTAIVGCVVLVLLITCANLANLSLTRAFSRQHELVTAAALGASRWRLVREQLTESLLIALAGSTVAFVISRALVDRIVEFADEMATSLGSSLSLENSGVTLSGLVVIAGSVVITTLVFGLGPALQVTRSATRANLTAGAGVVRARWRTQRRLIAWQVTGSVALLLIATLCIEQVALASRHDSGVDVQHLAVVGLDFGVNGRDETQARRTATGILERLHGKYGIESASASAGLPFGVRLVPGGWLTTPGHPTRPGSAGEVTNFVSATPDIFRTLGIRIVRGRAIDDRDGPGASPVAVASEAFVKKHFGTLDGLGQIVFLRPFSGGSQTPEARTIVGVVADTDEGQLGERGTGLLYVPFEQHYESPVLIVVRASGNPSNAVSAIRAVVRGVDPELVVSAAGTGAVLLAGPYLFLRIAGALSAMLGTVSLMLAMTGLFGVLSYVIERRNRELGIRMAIGADPGSIVRGVLLDGLRPVLDGVALGFVAGTIGRLAMRSLFPGSISIFDPVSLVTVFCPIVVAAVIACYFPARRASRVDPSIALREL